MVDTAIPLSRLQARNRRAAIAPRQGKIGYMNLARFGTICLAALLMTALWAGIIYFGGWAIGVRVETGVLLRILAVIFLLSMFGLGLAMSAGDDSGVNDGNRDQGM